MKHSNNSRASVELPIHHLHRHRDTFQSLAQSCANQGEWILLRHLSAKQQEMILSVFEMGWGREVVKFHDPHAKDTNSLPVLSIVWENKDAINGIICPRVSAKWSL